MREDNKVAKAALDQAKKELKEAKATLKLNTPKAAREKRDTPIKAECVGAKVAKVDPPLGVSSACLGI